MTLSSFVSKPVTLLVRRFQSNGTQLGETVASPSVPSTPYDLDDIHIVDWKSFPRSMRERASDESVKALV